MIYFTPREREIIILVGKGMNSKYIAGELHVKYSTIKNHLSEIYEKCHIPNEYNQRAWLVLNYKKLLFGEQKVLTNAIHWGIIHTEEIKG